jgi:DNA repair exonuclease SbcCD ATPase subunit
MTKKERARVHRERQQKLREERDRKKQCRVCGKPAAKAKRTGKLTKSCREHLKQDAGRKTVASDRDKLATQTPRLISAKLRRAIEGQWVKGGRERDADRNRTKRINGELVRPLTKLNIKGGEKILRLSLPKYRHMLAAIRFP